jgi:hypothetical protein
MDYSEKYILTVRGTAPNGGKTNIVTAFDDPDEAEERFTVTADTLPNGYAVTLDRVMTVQIAACIKA